MSEFYIGRFKKTESCSSRDRTILEKWINKEITTFQAMKAIEDNNRVNFNCDRELKRDQLEFVYEENFIAWANSMGWRRKK